MIGLLRGSSNHTLLAAMPELEGAYVVYKPQRGETPLWDFPPGTLYLREVAAFEVARLAGWDHVPVTIVRDGPYGVGSVQVFFDHAPEVTAFDLIQARELELMRIALFDLIVNNADRKAGHVFLDRWDGLRAIDHGVCFAVEPKLRTVLWDWVGEPIPADLHRECDALCEKLRSQAAGSLEGLLSAAELAELKARAERVAGMDVFPPPGPGRPYPWPPI